MEGLDEIRRMQQQDIQNTQQDIQNTQQNILKNQEQLEYELNQKAEWLLKAVRDRYAANRQKIKDLKNDLKAVMNDEQMRGSDFFTMLMTLGIGNALKSVSNAVKEVKYSAIYDYYYYQNMASKFMLFRDLNKGDISHALRNDDLKSAYIQNILRTASEEAYRDFQIVRSILEGRLQSGMQPQPGQSSGQKKADVPKTFDDLPEEIKEIEKDHREIEEYLNHPDFSKNLARSMVKNPELTTNILKEMKDNQQTQDFFEALKQSTANIAGFLQENGQANSIDIAFSHVKENPSAVYSNEDVLNHAAHLTAKTGDVMEVTGMMGISDAQPGKKIETPYMNANVAQAVVSGISQVVSDDEKNIIYAAPGKRLP